MSAHKATCIRNSNFIFSLSLSFIIIIIINLYPVSGNKLNLVNIYQRDRSDLWNVKGLGGLAVWLKWWSA
jgi:hypothetical protein